MQMQIRSIEVRTPLVLHGNDWRLAAGVMEGTELADLTAADCSRKLNVRAFPGIYGTPSPTRCTGITELPGLIIGYTFCRKVSCIPSIYE